MNKAIIIGAGLAGSEAALQLAKRGVYVDLYEMRPNVETGAHKTDKFAELVCSNSLGSYDITNASGLLKHEIEILESELFNIIKNTKVPSGGALSVDRNLFSNSVTEKILNNPYITVINKEVKDLNFDSPVIIASGPLTSESLSDCIKRFIGEDYLYFFDAIAPIVEKNSINFEKAFFKNRYNKGTADYINCPMNKEETRNNILETVEVGQVISGEVVRITDFGAFVDIGGIDALLPLSQISWRWVDHPSDILKVGETINVEVIVIDKEKQRISLSLKNLEKDPWLEAKDKINDGDKVEGEITRIKHFGAFVEVFPGVEALLPNNELVEYQNKNNIILKTGDKIQTTILKFNPEDRRISLSIKDE